MINKLLRNAFIYRADPERTQLPITHDQMIEALEKQLFEPVLPSMLTSTGFVPSPITGELVTPIQDGLAFVLRMDEKVLPAAAVNVKLAERVAEIEKEQDRKVYRKERLQLKEDVLATMVPQAFIKTRLVEVFYFPGQTMLIVSCASERVTRQACDFISSACAQDGKAPFLLPVVYPAFGLLTQRLARVMENEGSVQLLPGVSFWFDNYVSLRNEADRFVFSGNVIGTMATGVTEAIERGCRVERVGMSGDGGFAFRLNAAGHFKSVYYDDVEIPDDLQDDPAGCWRHEASVRCFSLIAAVRMLTSALSNEEAE